jgi:signal transduction histidine kinase
MRVTREAIRGLLGQARTRLGLRTRLFGILVISLAPTFLLMTIVQNQLALPFLRDEIRQDGLTIARTLVQDILKTKILTRSHAVDWLEVRMSEITDAQPAVLRVDVVARDPESGLLKVLASSVEEDPLAPQFTPSWVETPSADFKSDESGRDYWEIHYPIEVRADTKNDARAREERRQGFPSSRRILGSVHLIMSMHAADTLTSTLWKTSAFAGLATFFLLVLLLSYSFKRTLQNDQKLKEAEMQNENLRGLLHDAQRQLMNSEKLAVMGQLTGSFAHEIGTPLNAMSGHLQLLQEELTDSSPRPGLQESRFNRIKIIEGQLLKISQIVRGFLQSTAQPESQRQWVDLPLIAEKTLSLVAPRVHLLGVEVKRSFDRSLAPMRAVPLDWEQITLNLVNNSLDSLAQKQGKRLLELKVSSQQTQGKLVATLEVYDTGEGISRQDLEQVRKPFFTTKPPHQGTAAASGREWHRERACCEGDP